MFSAMSITAVIEKGMIKLPKDAPWPSGTVVRIEPVETPVAPRNLGQRLKPFSGSAKGLPADMARNHDHYLHGRPGK
jgi:hypothetical protein